MYASFCARRSAGVSASKRRIWLRSTPFASISGIGNGSVDVSALSVTSSAYHRRSSVSRAGLRGGHLRRVAAKRPFAQDGWVNDAERPGYGRSLPMASSPAGGIAGELERSAKSSLRSRLRLRPHRVPGASGAGAAWRGVCAFTRSGVLPSPFRRMGLTAGVNPSRRSSQLSGGSAPSGERPPPSLGKRTRPARP